MTRPETVITLDDSFWEENGLSFEQRLHTAMVLGCAARVACSSPDLAVHSALRGYTDRYAAGMLPSVAVTEVCGFDETEA